MKNMFFAELSVNQNNALNFIKYVIVSLNL